MGGFGADEIEDVHAFYHFSCGISASMQGWAGDGGAADENAGLGHDVVEGREGVRRMLWMRSKKESQVDAWSFILYRCVFFSSHTAKIDRTYSCNSFGMYCRHVGRAMLLTESCLEI